MPDSPDTAGVAELIVQAIDAACEPDGVDRTIYPDRFLRALDQAGFVVVSRREAMGGGPEWAAEMREIERLNRLSASSPTDREGREG